MEHSAQTGVRAVEAARSSVVCCESLTKYYGDAIALDDVSFTCLPGTVTVITGASGSGKTTLLRILGGMDVNFEGTVSVAGLNLNRADEAALDGARRENVGFVFQDYNLVSYLTAAENVALGLDARGIHVENDASVHQALKRVDLASKSCSLPRDLSGGERQRVAIARALAKDPSVVLADEPTGALDGASAREVVRLLASLAEEGRTVIVVTHDEELFRPYANQLVKICHGRTTVRLCDGGGEAEGRVFRPEEGRAGGGAESDRTSLCFLATLAKAHLVSCFSRCLLSALVCAVGALGLGVLFSLTDGMHRYSDDLEKRLLANTPVTAVRALDLAACVDGDALNFEDEGEIQGDGSLGHLLEAANMSDGDEALALLEGELSAYAVGRPDVLSVQAVYPLTNDLYARVGNGDWRFVDRWQLYEDVGAKTGNSSALATKLVEAMPDASLFFRPLLSNEQDVLESKFRLLSGRMPTSPDEVIVVTQPDGRLGDVFMVLLGLSDGGEVEGVGDEDAAVAFWDTAAPSTNEKELLALQLRVMQGCDYRVAKGDLWSNAYYERSLIDEALSQALALRVVGIATPLFTLDGMYDTGYIGFMPCLTQMMVSRGREADVSQAQIASTNIKVETGELFAGEGTLAASLLSVSNTQDIDERKLAYIRGLSDGRVRALLEALGLTEEQGLGGGVPEDFLEEVRSVSYQEFVDAVDRLAPPTLDTGYEDALAELDCYRANDIQEVRVYVGSLAARDRVVAKVETFNDQRIAAGLAPVSLRSNPEIDTLAQTLGVTVAVLLALGVMSVLVMVVTVGSTMGTFARERAHEIGCLRSLGIPRRQVELLFIIEAAALGATAALLGIMFGVLVCGILEEVVSPLLRFSGIFSFHPAFALAVFLATEFVCVLGTLVPARRAASLDPVQSLRL